MSGSVRKLVFCIALCSAPGVFADVIPYEPINTGPKDRYCSITPDRPAMRVDDILPVDDATPAPVTAETPGVRPHGPSLAFFLVAIMMFVAAKTTLLYRPVHRAGMAYARLYWNLFNPLEF